MVDRMKELKTIDEILEALYSKRDVIVLSGNMVVDCVRWDLKSYLPINIKSEYYLPIREGFKYFVEE